MDTFVLPIFPPDTMAASVTTAVWIGVCVVAFFGLRLGWTWSGLVVPGYIVPILIAKPLSGYVILMEAIVTYSTGLWLSDGIRRNKPGWCSFFGRDRFFLLVIISVLVRVAMDGYLLPACGAYCNRQFDLQLDYRNHLHSYGLIVVALLANYFWKPGLRRGLPPLVATLGLTYLIVRFVLVPLTNFNMGGMHYLYDDIASSILASPKAYIILLTTAFLGSWMNLRYGWEFNGILVPALLALQWHFPWKILITLTESALIGVIGNYCLRLPIWRGLTMEGPRKTLLFFTISFLYRMALGHLVPRISPNLIVTDYFGFGYLLSTLLALKFQTLHNAIRVTRAAIQVSIVGVVAANLIGFTLTRLPTILELDSAVDLNLDLTVHFDNCDLLSRTRGDKVLLYQQRLPSRYVNPSMSDYDTFRHVTSKCLEISDLSKLGPLEDIRRNLAKIHFELIVIQDRYLYLRELSPTNGWGIYIVDTRPKCRLSIQVPCPLDEPRTVESGLGLFRQLGAKTLAIAGGNPMLQQEGWTNQLLNPTTLFAAFHRSVGVDNTMQIRGYNHRNVRAIGTRPDSELALEDQVSSLWVKRSLPAGLSISSLRNSLSTFDLKWQPAPWPNRLRDDAPDGFCELVLNQRDLRKAASLLFSDASDSSAVPSQVAIVEGHLPEILSRITRRIARRGSNQFQPPTTEELLYVDEEVLQPLMRLSRSLTSFAHMTDDHRSELAMIMTTARVFGYEVASLHDRQRNRDYFVVNEQAGGEKHWGTCVVCLGNTSPYLIEVPRPLFDANAIEFGISHFVSSGSWGLILAGAHPEANADMSADPTRIANRTSFFHLCHQAFLRESNDLRLVVVQARAVRAPIDADMLIATYDGYDYATDSSIDPPSKATELIHDLVRELRSRNIEMRFVDGEPDVAGYEVGMSLQGLTMDHAENKGLVGLWLSPRIRRQYEAADELSQPIKQVAALGLKVERRDLIEHLHMLDASPSQLPFDSRTRSQLIEYAQFSNIVLLNHLMRQHSDWKWSCIVDQASHVPYLVIQIRAEHLPVVLNLSGRRTQDSSEVSPNVLPSLDTQAILTFIDRRETWLEFLAP